MFWIFMCFLVLTPGRVQRVDNGFVLSPWWLAVAEAYGAQALAWAKGLVVTKPSDVIPIAPPEPAAPMPPLP